MLYQVLKDEVQLSILRLDTTQIANFAEGGSGTSNGEGCIEAGLAVTGTIDDERQLPEEVKETPVLSQAVH